MIGISGVDHVVAVQGEDLAHERAHVGLVVHHEDGGALALVGRLAHGSMPSGASHSAGKVPTTCPL
jgi:hypothetical protein